MHKCKSLSGDGTYKDQGLWTIKETEKSYSLTCNKGGFKYKEGEHFILIKDYYPSAKFDDDGRIVIYIGKAGTPYIFEKQQ